MSGRWWRAYSRARHDPKLLKLSDKHFRWWFNFVCAASDNDGLLPSHEDLAVEFRIPGKLVTELLDALVAAGLLDHDETGIRPHNWNSLQYKTDVSTERVKRFRKRHETVSETPSETESDTEAETEQKDKIPRQARKTKLPADWQPTEELLAYAAEQGCADPKDTAERFRLHHQSKGTLGADWALGFKYWCRNEKNFKPAGKPAFKNRDEVAAVVVDRDDHAQWQARLRGYKPTSYWNQGEWGPRPGEPGCRVPRELLAERVAA